MKLTDERIDTVLGEAFKRLVAETGYNGGMGGETWDKAAARAIEAEVLRINGGGGEAVNRYLDVTLTKDETEYIAAFIADENDADDDVVKLVVGAGHSGFGLYAWSPEYQEEGSVLIKRLPEPEPLKAADEFELRRLLSEEQETVRQLTRALREEIDGTTFMGEPLYGQSLRSRLLALSAELDGELDSSAKWSKAQHTCMSVSNAILEIANGSAPQPQQAAPGAVLEDKK